MADSETDSGWFFDTQWGIKAYRFLQKIFCIFAPKGEHILYHAVLLILLLSWRTDCYCQECTLYVAGIKKFFILVSAIASLGLYMYTLLIESVYSS